MKDEVIPGLKLIYHSGGGVNVPDDPLFPFKLEGSFSSPEFMRVTFMWMRGSSEEIVVRAMTKEALDKLIEQNDFRNHPRLRRLTITGPDGVIEEIKGRMG